MTKDRFCAEEKSLGKKRERERERERGGEKERGRNLEPDLFSKTTKSLEAPTKKTFSSSFSVTELLSRS